MQLEPVADLSAVRPTESVLMADPNWNRGFYYDGMPPHTGMKLARRSFIVSTYSFFWILLRSDTFLSRFALPEIATITYRSGPEWEQRFGRRMRSQEPSPTASSTNPLRVPALCPDFLIETYLDHQGEQWCLKYDANSFIYISKAMDLFDMSASVLSDLDARRALLDAPAASSPAGESALRSEVKVEGVKGHLKTSHAPYLDDLAQGLSNLKNIPTLVLGVQSDILFPVEQQRDLAEALRRAGNEKVGYYELGGVWG